MVVVDKLTKVAHFVPIKMAHTTTNIAKIYVRDIARLHGIPKVIVFERDSKFTLNLWRVLFKGLGANPNFSTIYHPQLDGKIKRVNQVIEDMLRMYVMDKTSVGILRGG